MPFVIQSSTIPESIGAGNGGKPIHFNDFTHQLTFKGGDNLAVALATFSDGDELKQAKQWAQTAWGFSTVEIEPYDAVAEADKRQAAADKEAADREAASTEAKRILLDAKETAVQLVKDGQSATAKMVESATAILKDANEKATSIMEKANAALASAKEEREKAVQLVKDAKAKP